jgi:hypothetical protein
MNSKIFWLPALMSLFYIPLTAQDYPSVELSNKFVKMKLYIPDAETGFYRGTRFDWSGMISSLEYNGHEYFGEWRPTRDPLGSSDVTGPVDGYLAPGPGYDEAHAGGEFIRIGIGALVKPDEKDYRPFSTYTIIDNGNWTIKSRKDWIEFRHEIKRETGYAYLYKKRISLLKDKPGFLIKYSLKNKGSKLIETDQFNHNFFMIDHTASGPAFQVRFPFEPIPDSTERNRPGVAELTKDGIKFNSEIAERDVWVAIKGFGQDPKDNHFVLTNTLTGAGVQVQGDKPLYKLIFWATKNAVSPETFIYLKIPPGKKERWSSEYRLEGGGLRE